jgi:predicted nucleic acid-binding protein
VEWVKQLKGSTVALDTPPLIYFLEQRSRYSADLGEFFAAVDRGDLRIVTSTITLLEVLVHPLRKGDTKLAEQYQEILLHSRNFVVSSVTPSIARRAAAIRAAHSLKTPDAIQLATAVDHSAAAFLTNDRRMPTLTEVELLLLDDLVSG